MIDPNRRTIWIADAHHGDGRRFVMHAHEKLMAFVELDQRFALAANWLDRLARVCQNSAAIKTS